MAVSVDGSGIKLRMVGSRYFSASSSATTGGDDAREDVRQPSALRDGRGSARGGRIEAIGPHAASDRTGDVKKRARRFEHG